MQQALHSPKWSRFIGDRGFYRQVIALAAPVLIQNTVSNVVSLLDNVMVGQVGTLQMSAVAIINQLIFIFNLSIFGGQAGAGIFQTQFVGARDDDGVRYCFRFNILLSIGISVVSVLIFAVWPTPLINMYLTEAENAADAAATLGYASEYLFIMLFGLLPFAITQAYASTLRSLGETKLPMIASVAAILVNLVGNWLLIFGNLGCPQMGVVGAAIATVVSRFVEVAIVMIYTHTRSKRFVFIRGAYKSLHIPRDLTARIIKKGSPLLLNEFLWSMGLAMISQCYSLRGLDVVAANNIASTLSNLFKVLFMSMGVVVSVMVGTALGAGEFEKAKITVTRLVVVSIFLSLVPGILLYFCAPVIPNIYNTEADVRSLATVFLRIVASIMPAHAIAHACYFTLRSGGRTIITFFFDCVFTWLISFATAFILVHFTTWPIETVYLVVTLMDLLKVVLSYFLIKSGVWIRNIVRKDAEA